MFTHPPSTDHYDVILLRHGQSVGNAEGYWQGQSDFPLTEMGEKQAHALGEYWQQHGQTFDEIIASPLSRARQTAEIIAQHLNLSVTLADIWKERDNGKFAGMRGEEARTLYPQPDFMPPYEPIGDTGESQWELYLRAGQALHNLMNRPPGRYLVVAHGGILNLAIYAMLSIPLQANFHGPRFRFRNTAFATLRYYPLRHQWHVYGINQHPHWNFETQETA